jgi:muramoyltetrapeptide carboxypeptidase LdcA involved in peptidoglycan recycling
MEFCLLSKLTPGDTVAVLSPSAGVPALFPHIYELGIKRLREKCNLEVLEYPTTRMKGATAQERARDIMAAFSDTKVKAIFASIGGSDQITVLQHLDASVIKHNPKPFFGYSDNTNLCLFLWKLGIPSYYGGSIMCQFAMQGHMDEMTLRFINHALFTKGAVLTEEATEFTDDDLPWNDIRYLNQRRLYQPHEGNIWDAPTLTAVRGRLFGGCLESLDMIYKVSRWHPNDSEINGVVFCLETSEERPPADLVERFMMCMGVRGIWSRVSALLVGRPKTNMMDNPPMEKRDEYRREQREVMLREFRKYNPTAPVIFNMNFGHTDPQIALPLGHMAVVDPGNKQVTFEY